MKKLLIVLLFFVSVLGFSQTRSDTSIYIPMPVGGTTTEQSYFKENFEMETVAAGYATTESQRDADYTLKLEVKPNMIVYDDGTEEQAPPDEKQNVLELRLIRNEDDNEIVMFNFPFTEVEEMYEYNLYLLYQAMANVPLTKLGVVLETDHWRNKWLYVRASAGYFIQGYQLTDGKISENNTQRAPTGNEANETAGTPGGTLGLEFQFVEFSKMIAMSAEMDVKFLFGYAEGFAFIPAIGFYLKAPFKPSKHFMIEPYLGANATMITADVVDPSRNTYLGAGGGVQLGVKAGESGAIFTDVDISYDFNKINVRNGNRTGDWSRGPTIGFTVGYKLGFFNRHPDD